MPCSSLSPCKSCKWQNKGEFSPSFWRFLLGDSFAYLRRKIANQKPSSTNCCHRCLPMETSFLRISCFVFPFISVKSPQVNPQIYETGPKWPQFHRQGRKEHKGTCHHLRNRPFAMTASCGGWHSQRAPLYGSAKLHSPLRVLLRFAYAIPLSIRLRLAHALATTHSLMLCVT